MLPSSEQLDDVTSPPDPPIRPARRLGRVVGITSLVVLAVAVVAGFLVRVPYVIISPGNAVPLDGRVVSVSGAPAYRQSGNLLFLTVLESTRDPNLWRWLFAQLESNVDVYGRDAILGCSSYAEDTALNQTLMTDSQDAARIAAFRHLGLDATPGATRAVILGVECGSDALHKLAPGDVVTAIAGVPVTRVDDIAPVLASHKPGEVVDVAVSRPTGPETVSVRLENRQGTPRLGVSVLTAADWNFPADVKIDASQVGGPSAGLAFALAIVDGLTPGDLTHGQRVAVTGAIAADGTVGQVGGVAQKAAVAAQAHAKLMVVPRAEAREARKHADGVPVVGVRTLDEAIAALDRLR